RGRLPSRRGKPRPGAVWTGLPASTRAVRSNPTSPSVRGFTSASALRSPGWNSRPRCRSSSRAFPASASRNRPATPTFFTSTGSTGWSSGGEKGRSARGRAKHHGKPLENRARSGIGFSGVSTGKAWQSTGGNAMTVQIRSLELKPVAVSEDAVGALRAGIRGTVALNGDAGYEEARTVWNAMVDRKPGLVVRALGAADVCAAVNFARENGLLISIRSGGHQIAGHSVAEGAVLLDLSLMKSVRVDAAAKTAWVEPGATLGDVDKETAASGLVLPTGINSTTGIAGLTLGGGSGWLTRKYGMTLDHLLSADVVTADGKRLRASATENPDLFWAIRGGGGNFGVVTGFEFALHPMRGEILAGLIIHPFAEAPRLYRAYREIAPRLPEELAFWTVCRKAP